MARGAGLMARGAGLKARGAGPISRRWSALLLSGGVYLAAAALAGAQGCRGNNTAGATASAQASAPAAEALPGLKVSDDTPNLLLTWISEDGDFHVEESISKVPEDRRSRVRVVPTDQPEGSGASVYVADLTVKRPDGTYAVSTLARSEWEKLGADLRKTRMEALAPGVHDSAGTPRTPSEGAAGAGNAGPDNAARGPQQAGAPGAVSAIIYGADWCKPCHDAQRYLESLGVSVTKKNIEESRAAQAEMQEKLARSHRTGSSIPVIDVMGRIFVGYNPGSLKQAVDSARRGNAPKHG
jgi:glutaredoxin